MGNKKYIMCSGLAFADEEDMEMLHEYAKEGWIFERLRFGVLYELHRKQPQNRIYSYDSNAVKKKDKDDYLAMFEESGWHLVGQWSRDIRFFWAEAGTPALHSDAKVLGNQYRGLFFGSVACVVVAVICFLFGGSKVWLYALGGALLGGGGLLMIACYLRMKGKRLAINPKTYGYQLWRIATGIILLVFMIRTKSAWNFWKLLAVGIAGYFLLMGCIDILRIYLRKKQKKIRRSV